jgi:hypothetical protein
MANFTKPLRYSNSLRIMKMVSMGVKEIFPLTKCDKNFDLMFPFAPMCLDSLFYSSGNSSASTLNVDAYTCSLHFAS